MDQSASSYGQSHWVLPSKSLTGGCVLLLGIGVLLYIAGRVNHPYLIEGASVLWLAGSAAVVAGVYLVQRQPAAVGVTLAVPGAVAPSLEPVAAVPALSGRDIDRVRQLCTGGRFPFEVIESETDHDETGRLTKYALHALTPGYLSDRRNATMVTQRLQGAVSGDWLVDPQAEIDKVVVTRKKPFPPFVAPRLPARIVTSAQEAADRYAQLSVGIGIDELGNELRYRFITHHHWLVIGGTGSGKSVFVRWIIEELRAAGVAVFAGDGKGSDYTSLLGLPNVPMITSSPAEHVRLVHAFVEELDRRRNCASQRKIAGHPNPFDFEPWVLILDELATMRIEVRDQYEEMAGKDDKFIKDLQVLFKVGREFRMHIILSTQDLYAKTIPRDIVSQCKLIVTLGPPSDMTLRHAFTEEMAPKARQVGDLISAETPGRGLVAIPEDATVQEFQSYWGYTPGVNIEDPKVPEGIRPAWRTYREQVCEVIPTLYSRQWFKVEEPDDLDRPINELNNLEMVNLDLINGTPDPQMAAYDKLLPDYNGLSHGPIRPGELRHIDPDAEVPEPAQDAPPQASTPPPWTSIAAENLHERD